MIVKVIILASLLSLSACGPKPEDYAVGKPILRPEVFFNGDFTSYGYFQDYLGRASKGFTTKSFGEWHGNKGTMKELFFFNDGQRKERKWIFTKVDDHHYTGTASDVKCVARGEAYGNVLHWVYRITLPIDGEDQLVTFDDWLTLIDDNHMFSKIKITKWGIPVGKLTMFFEK
jgi:hypothetical protein